MANMAKSDFYYGAVLSKLFTSNKEHKPAIIEEDEQKNDRRVFRILTDPNHLYILRTHMSSNPRLLKKGSTSWTFQITNDEVEKIRTTSEDNVKTIIAVVLLDKKSLENSSVVYFNFKHFEAKGMFSETDKGISFTIRKEQDKNDYILFVDRHVDPTPVKTTLNLSNM